MMPGIVANVFAIPNTIPVYEPAMSLMLTIGPELE